MRLFRSITRTRFAPRLPVHIPQLARSRFSPIGLRWSSQTTAAAAPSIPSSSVATSLSTPPVPTPAVSEVAANTIAPAIDPNTAVAAADAVSTLASNIVLPPPPVPFYYMPVNWIQQGLEFVHSTGLPWWATIAVCTLGMRLALFPITALLAKNTAKMSYARPDMERWSREWRALQLSGKAVDPAVQAHMRAQMSQIYKKHGVAGGAGRTLLLTFAQMPVYICAFIALRDVGGLPSLALDKGFPWLTSLAVPDPYYILPCVSAATTIAMLYLSPEQQGNSILGSKAVKYTVGGVISALSISFLVSQPAAVSYYWVVTGVLGAAQGLLMRNQSVRDMMGIPPLFVPPPESSKRPTYTPQTFLEKPLPKEAEDKILKAAPNSEAALRAEYELKLQKPVIPDKKLLLNSKPKKAAEPGATIVEVDKPKN